MINSFKWNIDKFTTYVFALIVNLAENRGKNRLVFGKVHKVLIHLPCLLFNSKIVVYKQVHFCSLNVRKLLVKAREEYCQLVKNDQWNKKKDEQSSSGTKHHKQSDIAALFASK